MNAAHANAAYPSAAPASRRAVSPEPAPGIPVGLEILEKSINECGELARLLMDRLSPALRPASPLDCGIIKANPVAARSDLADRLDRQSDELRGLANLLRDMMARLDV